MPRTHLGTRIRSLRRSMGLSQKNLATTCGISPPYLNLIEHNRRGISGRTLIALAGALKVDPADLSEGMETALVDRVKKAALSAENLRVETDQTEEFTARFPGYARLIARLQDKADAQEHDFAALTDQMQNDPYFSEAIHMMLSSITTIRSTAEILSDPRGMDAGQSRKFTDNMRSEALRLSQTATDVLAHYEPSSGAATSTDISAFEALLEQQDHFLSDLEQSSVNVLQAIDAQLQMQPLSETDRAQMHASLQSYAQMAQSLPINLFLPAAKAAGFNPLRLAAEFQTNLEAIFFRLAHLPPAPDQPRFALLQVDGAGAVMYRKQLPSFALPRFGGACPLWPIYRSLAHPLRPLAAMLDMPFGERVFALSSAYPTEQASIPMPAPSESVMLATPDYALLDPALTATAPSLAVGLQCTICPRAECSARRSDYLLQS